MLQSLNALLVRCRGRRLRGTLAVLAMLIAICGMFVAAGATNGVPTVAGAGRTIIEGGTGGTSPVPVTTTIAFHASGQGGRFECLALAPPQAAGPGSGAFTVNAMYVTGPVTSVEVHGHSAILHGTAVVTGLGAGSDQTFTATVTEGGPGAAVVLEVSGLTFHETLLEGSISIR
jgi:hypothetical protein